MRMKATDSFNTSGLGTIHAGQEFEVGDALGKELEKKGHATVVGKSTPSETGADGTAPVESAAEGGKAGLPPINKMAATPANKARQPKAKEE